MPLTQGWSLEKMKHFNTAVGEVFLEPDEILYDVGSNPLCFYIVKQGTLSVEALVSLEE